MTGIRLVAPRIGRCEAGLRHFENMLTLITNSIFYKITLNLTDILILCVFVLFIILKCYGEKVGFSKHRRRNIIITSCRDKREERRKHFICHRLWFIGILWYIYI